MSESRTGATAWRLDGALFSLVILLFAAVAAHGAPASAPQWSHDGLQLRESKDLDLLYVRPEATLAGYRSVLLDPVEVAFHKSWKPDTRRVRQSDRERIRKELAEEARAVFTKELVKDGRYQMASAPGPDVLRVTAAIINLYVTAPDTMEAGISRTYTVSAGEMTLVAELRDSETGEILARAADRKAASNNGLMQWTTRVTNVAEARQILGSWAKILRKALDAARSQK